MFVVPLSTTRLEEPAGLIWYHAENDTKLDELNQTVSHLSVCNTDYTVLNPSWENPIHPIPQQTQTLTDDCSVAGIRKQPLQPPDYWVWTIWAVYKDGRPVSTYSHFTEMNPKYPGMRKLPSCTSDV